MTARLVLANDSVAEHRRVFFNLRDAVDCISPENGEAGGQPELHTNFGSPPGWTSTGIGVLVAVGGADVRGEYYALIDQSVILTAGTIVRTRFKSANTVETLGDTLQVVAFDPNDPNALGLSTIEDILEVADDIDAKTTNLPGDPAAQAKLDTVESRLTATRAGYMDKLNISGNVASSAEVTAVTNNTRVVRTVPPVIERPDVGTIPYIIPLQTYDSGGEMEVPDSPPTVALTDQSGTDLSSRLDSTTMAVVSPGNYKVVYTADASDTLEQLIWVFSVVEGGNTRIYTNTSIIVDTTAVDFTAADRSQLQAIFNKIPSKDYLVGTDNPDGDLQMDEATGNFGGTVAGVVDKAGFGLADGAITSAKIADGALTTAKFGTIIVDIWSQLTAGVTTPNSVGKMLIDNLSVPTSDLLTTVAFTAGIDALQEHGDEAWITGEVTESGVESIMKLLLADRYIDKTDTEQWKLVLIERESGGLYDGEVLGVWNIRTANGDPVISASQFIGQVVFVP